MVEVMRIMVTSFKRSHTGCTQCLQHCRRPPLTHTSTRDSWTLTGKSGSDLWGLMESLLLSPGSWCAQGFVCALQESVSPVLCKFCWLCGGVNGGLMPYTGLLHPEPLPLQQSTSDLYPQWETLKHSFVSVSVGSLGPGVHKVCLSPPSISGGCGFYSKCNFAPSTILLGLFLCPWMLGIIFGGIQLSPVNGYSAASCNFGALTGEDELMSFYSVILVLLNHGMFTWVLGQMLSDLLQR